MAKNTLENLRQYANKVASASVIALSGAALAACSAEQQKPYCMVDDGERIAQPSVGVMYFENSREYKRDATRYGEISAKNHFLSTVVGAVSEQLEPGTPLSVLVTSSDNQEADSRVLAHAVADDLTENGLTIGRVGVTVTEEGPARVNPLISVEPVCDWN